MFKPTSQIRLVYTAFYDCNSEPGTWSLGALGATIMRAIMQIIAFYAAADKG